MMLHIMADVQYHEDEEDETYNDDDLTDVKTKEETECQMNKAIIDLQLNVKSGQDYSKMQASSKMHAKTRRCQKTEKTDAPPRNNRWCKVIERPVDLSTGPFCGTVRVDDVNVQSQIEKKDKISDPGCFRQKKKMHGNQKSNFGF